MKTSLAKYKLAFTAVQFFIFSVPVGVHLVRPKTHFIFPPLGDANGFLVGLGLSLIGLFALLPWFTKLASKYVLAVALLGALVSCGWYVRLVQQFVVGVPIPDQGQIVYLSIGAKRSKNADTFFPDWPNRDMLVERGPREEEVRWLYTDDSINTIRNELFGSYVASLALINLAIGMFAVRSIDRESHKKVV